MVAKHSSGQVVATHSVASPTETGRAQTRTARPFRPISNACVANLSIHVQSPLTAENWALLEDSQTALLRKLPVEEVHPLCQQALTAPNMSVFVACIDGHPVGCAALLDCTTYGEVKHIFVRDEVRKQGIGRALMNEIEQYCRDIGLLRIKLESSAKLKCAKILYDRMGFSARDPFGDYPRTDHSLFLEKELGRLA